jgi:hypothetical protein
MAADRQELDALPGTECRLDGTTLPQAEDHRFVVETLRRLLAAG